MRTLYLGVLLRAHRRAATLDIALSELFRYGTLPGVAVRIHVMADRPSQGVVDVIEKYRLKLYRATSPTLPLLSAQHGEQFMPALNAQLADLEPANCDWYLVADDDQWWEPHHINSELPTALHNPNVDMWYAPTVFFWDTPTTFHPDRRHCSAILFRKLPGDRFPLNRIIHCTQNRHDSAIISGRTGIFKTPLLNYGSFDALDRKQVYDTYQAVGKIDPFVQSGYEAPPALARFPEDAVSAGLMPDSQWLDLWSKSNGCPFPPRRE